MSFRCLPRIRHAHCTTCCFQTVTVFRLDHWKPVIKVKLIFCLSWNFRNIIHSCTCSKMIWNCIQILVLSGLITLNWGYILKNLTDVDSCRMPRRNVIFLKMKWLRCPWSEIDLFFICHGLLGLNFWLFSVTQLFLEWKPIKIKFECECSIWSITIDSFYKVPYPNERIENYSMYEKEVIV